MGGASHDDIKSATLDHFITWNFSNDDTVGGQKLASKKSKYPIADILVGDILTIS